MKTATQRAIESAVQGGYGKEINLRFYLNLPEHAKHQIWNDPEFWKCLGKALDFPTSDTGNIAYGWKHQWILLINHLAEGKDIESFFEALLPSRITE